MRRLRGQLTSAVFGWLICQVMAMAAVPLALAGDLACASPEAACPAAMSAACPMHRSPAQARTCHLTSACAPEMNGVVALIGPVGALPAAAAASLPVDSVLMPSGSVRAPLPRSIVPDSPPPRA